MPASRCLRSLPVTIIGAQIESYQYQLLSILTISTWLAPLSARVWPSFPASGCDGVNKDDDDGSPAAATATGGALCDRIKARRHRGEAPFSESRWSREEEPKDRSKEKITAVKVKPKNPHIVSITFLCYLFLPPFAGRLCDDSLRPVPLPGRPGSPSIRDIRTGSAR